MSGQAEIILRSIADLRAEIASKEVQIQSLNVYATDQNPEAIRAQREIASLRSQLAALENSRRTVQPGDVEMPAGQVPEASLDYFRKYREVMFHETLVELLSKQYEAAPLDEAKSAPVIQVIDRVVPPEKNPVRTVPSLPSERVYWDSSAPCSCMLVRMATVGWQVCRRTRSACRN